MFLVILGQMPLDTKKKNNHGINVIRNNLVEHRAFVRFTAVVIYDIISAKVIMQRLCNLKCDLDASLP
jgi:hypothetical protein